MVKFNEFFRYEHPDMVKVPIDADNPLDKKILSLFKRRLTFYNSEKTSKSMHRLINCLIEIYNKYEIEGVLNEFEKTRPNDAPQIFYLFKKVVGEDYNLCKNAKCKDFKTIEKHINKLKSEGKIQI